MWQYNHLQVLNITHIYKMKVVVITLHSMYAYGGVDV
jgi:hypothetical protein